MKQKEKGIMGNKRKIVIGIVALIIILSVVVGIMVITGGDSKEPKDDVAVNGNITSAPIATATDEASSEPTATVPSTEEVPTNVPETTAPSTMAPVTVPGGAGTQDGTIEPVETEGVTLEPTITPTIAPTVVPTIVPTKSPTKKPTKAPTKKPTKAPTKDAIKTTNSSLPGIYITSK